MTNARTEKAISHESNNNVWHFVMSLEELAGFRYDKEPDDPNKMKPNRAALAQLRRTLGKHPNQAFEAFPHVVDWTHGQSEWGKHCYYLVAALFALYQQGQPRRSWHHEQEEKWHNRNLGASFRLLELAMRKRNGEATPNIERSKSLEKRFTALLSSRSEDLPDRLRHAVSLLKSYDVTIDWVQLLEDLLSWRHGERAVRLHRKGISTQRKWAQSFWRLHGTEEDAQTEVPATEGNSDN